MIRQKGVMELQCTYCPQEICQVDKLNTLLLSVIKFTLNTVHSTDIPIKQQPAYRLSIWSPIPANTIHRHITLVFTIYF